MASNVPLAPFYAWIFQLEDLQPFVTSQNGLKVTVKLKGEVFIQPREGTPLLKLSNRDGQVDLQREAETVFGSLLTDYRLTFDGPSGRVKFDCRMTQVGQAGAPNIGLSVPTPPDILAEFMTYKPFKGTIGQHGFPVTNFTVEITVSRDQPPSSPQPQGIFTTNQASDRQSIMSSINWDAVVGGVVLGVVAAALFFFPGTALAAAMVVVASGLGSALWNSAEAKGQSGPVTGGGRSGVIQLPEIVVTAPRPR